MNFAATARGFALVKCTNVPKGQLRMYLVGWGVAFFFWRAALSPSFLSLDRVVYGSQRLSL